MSGQDVDRYAIDKIGGIRCPEGDYVRFEDYQRLRTEMEQRPAEASTWTPVTERLPEGEPGTEDFDPRPSVTVLAVTAPGIVVVAYYQTWQDDDPLGDCWVETGPDGYRIDDVTHWRPLPPPPESGS